MNFYFSLKGLIFLLSVVNIYAQSKSKALNIETLNLYDVLEDVAVSVINRRMVKLFKLVDLDRNKELTRAEVRNWMSLVASQAKEVYLKEEFKNLDTNSDLRISFEEYLKSAESKYGKNDGMVDARRRAFVSSDSNKDGFIQTNELEVFLTKLKEMEDNNIADHIFKSNDLDGDGKITIDELIRHANSKVDKGEQDGCNKRGRRVKLTESEIEALKNDFSEADANLDGFLDKTEALAAVEAGSVKNKNVWEVYTPEEIEDLVDSVFYLNTEESDSEKSDTLSFEDVTQKLVSLFAESALTDTGKMIKNPENYPGLESLLDDEDSSDSSDSSDSATRDSMRREEL